MNFSLATDKVTHSSKKVTKTAKTVKLANKSKIIIQTKRMTIEPKYTFIGKSKKSYGPRYVKYNKDELISKAKCSCGKKSYSKYYTTMFKNYCVLCNKGGQIVYRDHYEGEWTCKACGADYCLVTGKIKLSSSGKYLIKLEENSEDEKDSKEI